AGSVASTVDRRHNARTPWPRAASECTHSASLNSVVRHGVTLRWADRPRVRNWHKAPKVPRRKPSETTYVVARRHHLMLDQGSRAPGLQGAGMIFEPDAPLAIERLMIVPSV